LWEEGQTIETALRVVQMLDLASKDPKTDILNMFIVTVRVTMTHPIENINAKTKIILNKRTKLKF
jgi:hypothetical protein